MKKVLLLAMALTMVASLGFAQTGGHIGLYSDAGSYAECNLLALPATPLFVYVVHTLTDANGAQFKLVDNGSGLFKSGYASAHALNVGNDPFVETAVTYDGGGCPHTTPILIGTLTYFNLGGAIACGSIEVIAAPTINKILGLGCDGVEREATGGILTVNGDQSCPCLQVANEETTWGQMKALYN
jgi:hypothetical protein